MQPTRNSRKSGHQMLVPSPRCSLNCQSLSIHLPPLGDRRYSSGINYLSPPMSASYNQPQFDESQNRSGDHRPYSLTPPSRPSTSDKSSPKNARATQINKPMTKDALGGLQTPSSTETSGTSLQLSDTNRVPGDSNDDLSSNPQDSPGSQLVAGPPGIARRAKAHVPSACVNCKKKHLACETKRPCNRCMQTGKEASCVDVQHKKRGRPRLREEENIRDVGFEAQFHHGEMYQNQSGVLPVSEPGRPRSKTYRELRSQPEITYVDQRPGTSDPSYHHQQYSSEAVGYSASPSATYLSESIPTVLLTPDFIVAQHNRAFSDALSIPFAARGQALLDLIVPAEREKIQRLHSVMRAELRDAAHVSLMRGDTSSRTSMPAIEQLDIARATAGFRTRSEYWTFRLPREQTRGFPISISLAKDGGHFVVLTLVQSASALQALQSPPVGQVKQSPLVIPSSSIRGMVSPPQQSHHSHQAPYHQPPHRTSPSDVGIPYLISSPASNLDNQMLQLQQSHSLAQYKQSSPPRSVPLPYNTPRTDSSGSTKSDIPRSSPGHHQQALFPADNLRHLQLPPIRTTPTSDPSHQKDSLRGRQQTGTTSPSRSSPHSGKRKKRRRVDIGEMLH